MKPVKSSNIEAVGYKDGIMSVKFKTGNTYHYEGVTPEQHHAFVNAKSIGSHFHTEIRGKFTYTRKDAK